MTIRFNTCTPSPCDLPAPAGFGYCGTIALPECARVRCFALANIVTEQGNNRLTPLDCLRDRKGVYMVVDGDAALYVGSSARISGDWNLRERIAQHFRKKDRGGTLRKNWERAHCGDSYRQFVQAMHRCRLQVISFGEDADNRQVLRLEYLLIGLLGPLYCDVPE